MAMWIIQDPGTYGLRNVFDRFEESDFCIQFQILDNALIMQSNASVDHSGWSTESVDCIIKALSRIVLRIQDWGLDFRRLITVIKNMELNAKIRVLITF